jgi:replication-associated recombination protein RarA
MATDMEILKMAYQHENDPRRHKDMTSWEYYAVGASRGDIQRLIDEGLVTLSYANSSIKKYKLSEKGRSLVWATMMEREFKKIPAKTIIDAMDLVIGYTDLKKAISNAIESGRRIHFLLEGPPACAKSVMLEAVRTAVEDAYMAFGSRTSASGLSDALFEHQPRILLLDEADKMHNDVYSVLLGLMESGEILETKSQKTRGIKLECMIIAACNGHAKMPREFLSRFALHAFFPKYTREEFIEVCEGFLTRAEQCPFNLAQLIGRTVYDRQLGDVRKARAVWQMMTNPSQEEVERIANLMEKYSPDLTTINRKARRDNRQPELL